MLTVSSSSTSSYLLFKTHILILTCMLKNIISIAAQENKFNDVIKREKKDGI